MMGKIGLVTKREIVSIVTSKGFLIGLITMPVFLVLCVIVAPRVMHAGAPQVVGEVAVIDPTHRVTDKLQMALEPSALQAQASDTTNGERLPGSETPPHLTLVARTANADIQQEKHRLAVPNKDARRIALIVVHPDAIERAPGEKEFGSYDLYLASGVSEATESVIHDSLRRVLVGSRLKAGGLDMEAIETTMRVNRPSVVNVAPEGEKASQRGISRLLPFICGLLLFMGVMTGGQTLMASMVEEKSSRVIEVLLAAVSPVELMWGKLLGQLTVGLLVMFLYLGLGFLGLTQTSMLGLLEPQLIVYLVVFYLISYLVYGGLMMAIGAAVNQMADAQALMGPVMVLLIVPYALSFSIGQAPNTPFSVAMSFIPPMNSFAMLARLASYSPPPMWQALLSIGVGLLSAVASVGFAAKVFRIGLLMHGKPPNLATLIRWVKRA